MRNNNSSAPWTLAIGYSSVIFLHLNLTRCQVNCFWVRMQHRSFEIAEFRNFFFFLEKGGLLQNVFQFQLRIYRCSSGHSMREWDCSIKFILDHFIFPCPISSLQKYYIYSMYSYIPYTTFSSKQHYKKKLQNFHSPKELTSANG